MERIVYSRSLPLLEIAVMPSVGFACWFPPLLLSGDCVKFWAQLQSLVYRDAQNILSRLWPSHPQQVLRLMIIASTISLSQGLARAVISAPVILVTFVIACSFFPIFVRQANIAQLCADVLMVKTRMVRP